MEATPPPPPPPPHTPVPVPALSRLTWPVLIIGAIVLLGVGVAIGSGLKSSDVASPSPTSGLVEVPNEPGVVVEESPSPEPEPPAEAEGSFELASCDANIDSSAAGGIDGALIGSTRVVNTGTVPIEVKVTFRWLYGDGTKQDASPKTVTVVAGGDKLVFFNYPATIDEIGSFQDNPDYTDSTNCKTDAAILN